MKKQLVKSTATVSSLTLLSRIFGLFRDLVLARVFGAAWVLDTFIVAFKIPNFMRRLFAEGAFSQAFVPILADYQKQQDPLVLEQFIGSVITRLAVSVLIAVVLGILLAPLIMTVVAPGFIQDPKRFALTVHLLRMLFPFLFLITMTAFSSALLNSYGYFAVPAFTPVLLNLSLIAGCLWLSHYFDPSIQALAVAALVAGILQWVLQLLTLWRKQLFFRWRWDWKHPGVKRVIKLMGGGLIGASIIQLGALADTLFASFLPHGSVSWLYYAERLMQFPLGIFGVAVTTVILPQLATQHTLGSGNEFSSMLDWAMRSILVISLPASIGLLLLSQPISITLFYYGHFTQQDVLMTSQALMAFAVGVVPAMLLKPLVAGFYARKIMRTPIQMSAIALSVNVILNALFIVPLRHSGLALATSIAIWVNIGLLIYRLQADRVFQLSKALAVFTLKVLLASGVMALGLMWMSPGHLAWVKGSWHERILLLLLIIIVAKMMYFGCLALLKVRLQDIIGKSMLCD